MCDLLRRTEVSVRERCTLWLHQHLTAALPCSLSADLQLNLALHIVPWWTEDGVGGHWHSMETPSLYCGFGKFDQQPCLPTLLQAPMQSRSPSSSCEHANGSKPPVMFMLWRRAAGALIKLKICPLKNPPKKTNLWVPSAPSGGHHGQQNHPFASVVTLLSTAHEWLWNWPFYWIWWSITAQMEVRLPQGTGDIA